ncbi:hypothetical protein TIFTF001_002020 [Ficus carica]|uniref:Uncharacterized protein n=1 Tax=Ficus carica TaxID=3494 RepID=A0AA87ZBF1_FICCA|nr:hypothetical protein TIFTF001_002020 [Ficus carica]
MTSSSTSSISSALEVSLPILDVVPLAAMEIYVDCSQIQPYKCNRQQVIALNPLPHSGPAACISASCNGFFKEVQ